LAKKPTATAAKLRTRSTIWTSSFERDGAAYGVEVKNTLGYLDVGEFLTKIRLARHLGVKPVFAVRALPKTWANALIKSEKI
jgi:hypothetical protein